MALTAVALAVGLGAACAPAAGPPSAAAGAPLRVAVSVPPQAWLVEAVGGERVAVVSLVGPGDSAETYQPTDAQVSRVMRSRLYFRGGVPFERGSWFAALSSAPGLEVVDLRAGVERLAMDPSHAYGGAAGVEDQGAGVHDDALDPHLWLSPRRLAVQAGTVAAALAAADPEHAGEYRRRLAATRAELAALDRELADRLAPWAGRPFYVFHPAWGYLADDYDLHQVAIEVEGKSPSDAELSRLQERARGDGVAVVFVQRQVPHRAADAVAAAVGAETRVLDPLAADLPAGLRATAAELAAAFAAADRAASGERSAAGEVAR